LKPKAKTNTVWPDQREWDHSGIQEWELRPAIFYEAIRSHDEAKKVILSGCWHFLSQYPPRFRFMDSIDAYIFFKLFPPDRPWLSIPLKKREQVRPIPPPPSGIAFFTMNGKPIAGAIESYVHFEQQTDNGPIASFIDWTKSNTQLKKDFGKHIQSVREAVGQPEQKQLGPAPYEALKWISALRLRRYGFEKAQDHVEKILSRIDPRIHPIYTEDRAWRRTIKNALALVSKCVNDPFAVNEFLPHCRPFRRKPRSLSRAPQNRTTLRQT
jgi:hypothetical protein